MGAGGGACGAAATGEKSAKLLSEWAGARLEYVGEGNSNGLNDPGLLLETRFGSCLSGIWIFGADTLPAPALTHKSSCYLHRLLVILQTVAAGMPRDCSAFTPDYLAVAAGTGCSLDGPDSVPGMAVQAAGKRH